MAEAVGQNSNSKGSRMLLSGGFPGDWTPLGSNPRSQLFLFTAFLHFVMKMRKFDFFSVAIFSFDT